MKLVIDERTAGRILVVLDASRQGFAALEAAAALAGQLRAELHGLFIEDASLLKLALCQCHRKSAFPFALRGLLMRPHSEDGCEPKRKRRGGCWRNGQPAPMSFVHFE